MTAEDTPATQACIPTRRREPSTSTLNYIQDCEILARGLPTRRGGRYAALVRTQTIVVVGVGVALAVLTAWVLGLHV